MNQRNEFVLVKPSMGKYVISFIIIHSPTWDGSGLFIGDSVDHWHPTEGQGLIPSGWFCVHSKIILMAYPCSVTPWQSQGQHLDLRLSHQDHPTKPLWPVGASQCKDSISRLGWLWSLLLRLDNEGHKWEGLWSGCLCTKGAPHPCQDIQAPWCMIT